MTYRKATEVYSKTVAELARGIGKLNRIEHDRLSVAAERACLTAQEARNDIDAHTIEHGC